MNKEFKPLRVLLGCEYSGIVRDAFLAKGHDAMSCDLLPTESPGRIWKEKVHVLCWNGKSDGRSMGLIYSHMN